MDVAANEPRRAYGPTVMDALPRAGLVVCGSAVIVVACLSGCSTSSQNSGTISGTANPCVGLYNPAAHYTIKLVSVVKGTRTVAKQENLASPYRFTFSVPPGTYSVTATGNSPVQARVERGKTVTVALHTGCT